MLAARAARETPRRGIAGAQADQQPGGGQHQRDRGRSAGGEHRQRDDHRHPRGWRVDPGPSGRGKPTVDPAPPRFPVLSPRWILFVVAALAFNVWLVSYLPDPPQRRVRIP